MSLCSLCERWLEKYMLKRYEIAIIADDGVLFNEFCDPYATKESL